MSKPVTNEEVEDVLSSIRRLVSEDKRPLAGLRSAGAKPERAVPETVDEQSTASGIADRFVLTPALRVIDTPDEARVEESDEPLDLGSVAREINVPHIDSEDEGGDKPLMLYPSEKDSDDSDDASGVLAHEPLESSARGSSGDDLEDGDYSDEGYWDVEKAPDHDADERIEGKIELASDWDLDVVETIQNTDETSDDSTSEFEADAVGHVSDQDGALGKEDSLQSENSKTTTSEELFFEPELDDERGDETSLASTISITAKIAALEAAVGEIASEWEPEGDEMETFAASVITPAMMWENDVQLDAKGAPVADEIAETGPEIEVGSEETVSAAPNGGKAVSDDQLMDEDALRDLVGEIVRTELQGALGERITRNVRKLVRREIHRALTAHEME